MKMEMKMASCYGDNEKCSSCEESIWDCKCHEKKPPEKSNAEMRIEAMKRYKEDPAKFFGLPDVNIRGVRTGRSSSKKENP